MKIQDTSTPVVVLGSVGHGGLNIMRSLGPLGVPLYNLHSDRFAPTFFSRYCRGKFVWDIEQQPPEKSLEYLLDVGRKIGRPPILIPTTDFAATFVADHDQPLREWFLFPHQRPGLVHTLCSKKEMYFLSKRLGIPTAETFFPQSRSDLLNFLKSAAFPIVLKGIDGRLLWLRSGKRMYIVRTERELLEKYDALEDPENPNLMLQEYIPGGDDTVWMFNGYFNERSECLLGFTGKKIRQCPVHRGVTSLGICLRNQAVEATTKDFMKAIGYKGILDIGYRYDARDGQYKVLDVNPRIGATFRLFVAENGMDVARALYLDLTGQPVLSGTLREGRKWLVEDLDLASCFHYFRAGELTFKEWLRSFRGVEEAAYFAPGDLLPLLAMCVDDVPELARRIYGGLRRKLGRPKSSRLSARKTPTLTTKDIRVAWVWPSLVRAWRWHPVFREFTKLFPKTVVFTGIWPGFTRGFEGTFKVEKLSGVRMVGLGRNHLGVDKSFAWVPPWTLLRLLRFRPDLLFTDGFSLTTAYALIVKALTGSPVVLLWQGVGPETWSESASFRLWVRRMMAPFLDLTICNTREGVEYLRNVVGIPAAKLWQYVFEVGEREPLCAQETKEDVLPSLDRPVFLFVGRFIRVKGVHKLLEASRLLLERGLHRFSLVLVGDGPQKQELSRLSRAFGLEGRVRWPGFVPHEALGPYYRACDVFVLPSLKDNWGVVVPEAMALGKPVLCSQHAGAHEMVRHGRNGFVFDPYKPEDLAGYMERFIRDPGLIEKYGVASNEIIAQHTHPRVAGVMAGLVASLLDAEPPLPVPQGAPSETSTCQAVIEERFLP